MSNTSLVSKPTMGKLSTELILDILEYAHKGDMKSMRLVSRRFNTLSSTVLFRRVYASMQIEDLRVLEAISRHPTLRFAVREVVYCEVAFWGLDPNNPYEFAGQTHYQPLAPERVHAHPYYYDRFREQKEFEENGEDKKMITAALTMLPNIRRVIFTNHWCTEFEPPFARHYPSSVARPGRFNLVAEQEIQGQKWCIGYDRGFKVMCEALAVSGRQVQELLVHYDRYWDHEPRDTFLMDGNDTLRGFSPGSFPSSPLEMNHACMAFRHLCKIHFSYDSELVETGINVKFLSRERIPKVFAAATELEELSFDFNFCRSTSLEDALGTHHWPRLRSLKLCRGDMMEAELVALLERHCSTLEVLELERIGLGGGGWLTAATEFHKLKWPKMKSVSIHRPVDLHCRADDKNRVMVDAPEVENSILRDDYGQIYISVPIQEGESSSSHWPLSRATQ